MLWYDFRMKGLKEKHRDIVGQTIRKNHLPQWDELRFMEFFAMIHHFCPKGEWMWNPLAVKTFCQQAETRPIWEEWMWRFEMLKETTKIKSISGKIMVLLPIIGTYLQSNPHNITVKMRERMKGHVKLAKYTEPFKVVQNELGADLILPNTDEGHELTLPEVQYHKAILKMSAIANDLIEGLTKDQLKKMSADDRIKLSLQIINTMSRVTGGQKPNLQIFKQLVVNNASREDLEKAMVAYTQD